MTQLTQTLSLVARRESLRLFNNVPFLSLGTLYGSFRVLGTLFIFPRLMMPRPRIGSHPLKLYHKKAVSKAYGELMWDSHAVNHENPSCQVSHQPGRIKRVIVIITSRTDMQMYTHCVYRERERELDIYLLIPILYIPIDVDTCIYID